jgi:hypothetical protein
MRRRMLCGTGCSWRSGRPSTEDFWSRPGIPTLFPVAIGNSDAHVQGSVGATFTYVRING